VRVAIYFLIISMHLRNFRSVFLLKSQKIE